MEEKALERENAGEMSEEISEGNAFGEACGAASGNGGEDELRAENLRLRGELACAKLGVPGEIAGDIISIAAAEFPGSREENSEDIEAAVREVYERISAAVFAREKSFGGRKTSGVTTGVRVERNSVDSEQAFRRACGLKC